MRKALLGLAVGAATLVMSTAAGACSRMEQRPLGSFRQQTYDERAQASAQPLIADLMRNAAFLDVARAIELESYSIEEFPQTLYHAHFEQIFALNGGGGDFFLTHIDESGIWGTGGHESMVAETYLVRYRDRWWDFESTTPPVGHTSRNSCGSSVGVFIQPGWTYLVGHDGNGSASFVVPVANDTESESLAGALETHQWIAAARHALAYPVDPHIKEIELRDYISGRTAIAVVEVDDCRYPSFTTIEAIGGEPRLDWLERTSAPLTLEDYLASDSAHSIFILPGQPPLGKDDFAVLEERRYDSVPFNAETCQQGQRFLVYGWYKMVEVDENNMVDFSDIPTQLRVLDAGLVPLSTVRFWLSQDDE